MNSCPECARYKVLRLARAVELTRPDFALTLSLVGEHFSVIQAGLQLFLRSVRRQHPFKIGWVVECNGQEREGHAHHIHGACYGAMPDPQLLSEKAQAAGFGREVDVAPVRSGEAWGEYLFKQVRNGDLRHHLEMNGGQLIHTSDHYYRVDGEPVRGGVDAALREAKARGLLSVADPHAVDSW